MQLTVTAFKLETWCSILWNRTVNLFGNLTVQAAKAHARHSYPRECIGFVVATSDGHTDILPLRAQATPITVEMDSTEVVKVAYQLAHEGKHVVATYHSHPNGSALPSLRDDALSLWSSSMLLLVRESRENSCWVALVYRWSSHR